LTYKHHGKPPGKSGLFAYFFAFASLIAFDLVLVMAMVIHVLSPMDNLRTIGITFCLMYPGIAVLAPFFGLGGCIFGEAWMLKVQSSMNAACVLLNYPATLAMMWFIGDETPYVAVVIALWLNKIPMSFYGAKVRQHLINPGFVKNQDKFQELTDLQLSVVHKFPKSRILAAEDDEQEEGTSFEGE